MKRRSQTTDSNKNADYSDSDDSDYTDETSRPKRKSRKQIHPHVIVHHNYHDHSNEPIAEAFPPKRSGKSRVQRTRGTNVSFPVKLYEMLEQVEKEGLSDVISWQPHGRCFLVHKPDEFKETMSKYFKLSKISSFQRQLNLYGFTRLTAGFDKSGYYHEYVSFDMQSKKSDAKKISNDEIHCQFIRGRPDLAALIHRNKVKGTGVRAKSNPNAEPNFYTYPAVDVEAKEAIEVVNGTQSNEEISSQLVLPTSFYLLDRKHLETGIHDDIWKPNLTTLEKDVKGPKQESLVDMVMYGGAQDIDESYRSLDQSVRFLEDAGSSSDVSFDILIDEMFRQDQKLNFQDLRRIASL